jgi:hypothetical protein
MAAILLSRIKWYALANWGKRSYFFTRMLGQCCHSNGSIYLAAVGVNRRTNGWDGVILVAPPNGGVRVHHEFEVLDELGSKATSVQISELTPPNGFAGNLLVTFTTESEDFDPESWVITP